MKVQFVQEVDGWIWDGKQETVDEINKHTFVKTKGKLETINDLLVLNNKLGNSYIQTNNWVILDEKSGTLDIFPVSEFISLGYKEISNIVINVKRNIKIHTRKAIQWDGNSRTLKAIKELVGSDHAIIERHSDIVLLSTYTLGRIIPRNYWIIKKLNKSDKSTYRYELISNSEFSYKYEVQNS